MWICIEKLDIELFLLLFWLFFFYEGGKEGCSVKKPTPIPIPWFSWGTSPQEAEAMLDKLSSSVYQKPPWCKP